MELTVFERLILLNILPREGNITTIKIIRQLRDELSFTEEEHAALQFKSEEDGRVLWRKEADKPKNVNIGVKAHGVIADRLKELDKQKKLTEQHLSVWDKFNEE